MAAVSSTSSRLSSRPSARRARPTSEPHRWRQRNVPARWKYRLAPDPRWRRRKGPPDLFARVRRVLWAWWPWTCACLCFLVLDRWGWAAFTGAMALACHLAAPVEEPPQYGLEHRFGVRDPEFLPTMIGATGVPFAPGNRIDILNNGDAFYPAMLDAIHGAEASVTVEAYIYWDGAIGLEFAQALAARAAAGVPVKILLDAVGSASIGEQILGALEAGGCQVAWYNPVHWYTLGRVNHRTHRKSLIIDGRIGFTGGAGIADHWRGHAQDAAHWRDLQIRVEGPAVTPLQTGFAQNWLQTTGELVTGSRFYPTIPASGPLAAQTVMSSPEAGASSARTMYLLSIICAREAIYIANPYFVPDPVAIAALVDAKRRGVDVRVMVSGTRNDNWIARQNSLRVVGALLRAGIVVLEYNRTMLHQKTMVVDAVWATVGTTNFDNRSFAHNEENNVCVFDAAWARELHEIFLEDVALCEPLTLDVWQRRGLRARAQELIAGLLQEQV